MSKASPKKSEKHPEDSGKFHFCSDAKKESSEKRFTAEDIKQFIGYFEVLKKIHVRSEVTKQK